MATAAARAQPRPSRRAQEQPRPRARPRPAPRRRAAARPRLAGSVAWILVVAGLLAGIVALNVGVLRLNMEAERLEEQRNELVARGDALSAELSRSAAAGRVESIAVEKLGLARPNQTTYVRLARARASKGH
jgi:cell division protein FtsL